MNRSDQRLLGQLETKLDDLHEDVRALRSDVDELKKDFIRRGVLYKGLTWVMGILTTLGTIGFSYFINHR
jgi:hypothetical protein